MNILLFVAINIFHFSLCTLFFKRVKNIFYSVRYSRSLVAVLMLKVFGENFNLVFIREYLPIKAFCNLKNGNNRFLQR